MRFEKSVVDIKQNLVDTTIWITTLRISTETDPILREKSNGAIQDHVQIGLQPMQQKRSYIQSKSYKKHMLCFGANFPRKCKIR